MLLNYGYKTKNGKTTINIKLTKNSSIHHSCDFALINVFMMTMETNIKKLLFGTKTVIYGMRKKIA